MKSIRNSLIREDKSSNQLIHDDQDQNQDRDTDFTEN